MSLEIKEPIKIDLGKNTNIKSLMFNNNSIILCNMSGELCIYDTLDSNAKIHTFGQYFDNNFDFNPCNEMRQYKNDYIIAYKNIIFRWEYESDYITCKYLFDRGMDKTQYIHLFDVHLDKLYVCYYSFIIIWNLLDNTIIKRVNINNISKLKCFKDNIIIVDNDNDYTIYNYDFEIIGKPIPVIGSPITDITMLDNRRIITGQSNGRITIWNHPSLILSINDTPIIKLIISPDNQYIISIHLDLLIYIWHITSQKCISILKGNTSDKIAVVPHKTDLIIIFITVQFINIWNITNTIKDLPKSDIPIIISDKSLFNLLPGKIQRLWDYPIPKVSHVSQLDLVEHSDISDEEQARISNEMKDATSKKYMNKYLKYKNKYTLLKESIFKNIK